MIEASAKGWQNIRLVSILAMLFFAGLTSLAIIVIIIVLGVRYDIEPMFTWYFMPFVPFLLNVGLLGLGIPGNIMLIMLAKMIHRRKLLAGGIAWVIFFIYDFFSIGIDYVLAIVFSITIFSLIFQCIPLVIGMIATAFLLFDTTISKNRGLITISLFMITISAFLLIIRVIGIFLIEYYEYLIPSLLCAFVIVLFVELINEHESK